MDDSELWASPLPSLHRLRGRPRLVDRVRFLEDAVAGRDVIHLGFIDVERLEDKAASGTWLHERLARRAKRIVGVDLDAPGVESAAESGYEAYQCDLQDSQAVRSLGLPGAELVVAGELIEHLDCPGAFLDAVQSLVVAPSGRLLLTTPNATSLTNVLVGLSRREWTSPQHVAMYSWRTLATLLSRHGWTLTELLFYFRGRRQGREAMSRPGLAALFNVYERASRPLLHLAPTVADGLIAIAKPSGRSD